MIVSKKETIRLYPIVNSYLITRETIRTLFSQLEKSNKKKIEIDFDKVFFISRSSADEYIKLKKSFNKLIKEKNLSKDVRTMFNLVNNSSKDFKEFEEIKIRPMML